MTRRVEGLRARLWAATKGSSGSWVGLALACALVTLCILAVALLVPGLRPVAVVVALADLVLLAVLHVAMLARVAGHAQDAAANVSLQGYLARSGFTYEDFFVDGAAASPQLQLTLVKILDICHPRSILELGSGQTTKVLSHYARRHPDARVLTLEENPAWAALLSQQLQAPQNHSYCESRLQATTVTLPTGEAISANWFRDGDRLLAGRTFDFVLVDGPTNWQPGTEFVRYSRIGILPFLPQVLAERFVIVLDDTDNYGYAQTAEAIRAVLARDRKVCVFQVHGVKSQTVICSAEWQFLRSV